MNDDNQYHGRATKRRRLAIDSSESIYTSPIKSPTRHKQQLRSTPRKSVNSPLKSRLQNSPRRANVHSSPIKYGNVINEHRTPTFKKSSSIKSPHSQSKNRSDDIECTPTKSLPGADFLAVDSLLSPIGSTPPFMNSPANKSQCKSLPPVSDFDPCHFIRCHTGGHEKFDETDPTDNLTQVWKCASEPDPNVLGAYTGIVATCGGRTICLVDSKTGKIMKRSQHQSGGYFSVAWTTLMLDTGQRQWSTNILAAAGVGGTVRLFHPEMLVYYHSFKISDGKDDLMTNVLLFHPEKNTLLFCGCNDGNIYLWDIGIPSGAEYKTKSVLVGKLESNSTDVLSLVYHIQTPCLIAGTNQGCFVWKFNRHKKPEQPRFPKEVILPIQDTRMVDSIALLNKEIIVSKVVNTGVIQLWNLRETLDSTAGNKLKAHIIANLKWSDVESFYLSLDCHKSGLVACGDSNGDIWLYNVGRLTKQMLATSSKITYAPSAKLLWPICDVSQSGRVEETKMIDLIEDQETEEDEMGPIINTIHISPCGKNIIAGTQNNLLCIWTLKDFMQE